MTNTDAQAAYYDAEYYTMWYSRLINDPAYYALSGAFWQHNVFECNGLLVQGPVLDWGSGPGHISAAMQADCYDPSAYIQQFLASKGRVSHRSIEEIPKTHYQTIICSHALEHSSEPARELDLFKAHLTGQSRLALLLPIEPTPGKPVSAYDENRHFYTWNFQAITNLLLDRGFTIVREDVVYGPTGLGFLGRRLGPSAVKHAWRLGRLKRNYPSLLVVADHSAVANV